MEDDTPVDVVVNVEGIDRIADAPGLPCVYSGSGRVGGTRLRE